MQHSDAGSNKSDAKDNDTNDVSAAQGFHKVIKEKAKLSHVLGDVILTLEEVLVLTPRCCYNIDMFQCICVYAVKCTITRLCIQAYQGHSFYQMMTSIFPSLYALCLYTQFLYWCLVSSLALVFLSDKAELITSTSHAI